MRNPFYSYPAKKAMAKKKMQKREIFFLLFELKKERCALKVI